MATLYEFLGLFVAFYIWHAMGITVGYHRLLSHRTFSCSKPVEYFWVLAGFLAFEGSPIWWSTMHRAHHRHVDTPLDPHSPRWGLNNAHVGWLTLKEYPAHIDPKTQSKDLMSDPVYRFLERLSHNSFCSVRMGPSTRKSSCRFSRSANSTYAQRLLPHSETRIQKLSWC
jgi:fatty-acid desaturase